MFVCPNCGANIKFDPGKQLLHCDYCESDFAPDAAIQKDDAEENTYTESQASDTSEKGYEEYTKRINKLTVRINNIKKNYIGEEASSIVNRDCANAICVETLDIRGMSIRNKTREAEGKKIPNKVKRRRKMAHKLGQLAIGSIISQIEYDSIKAGKHFIKAPANYASTKICNCCGHKLEDIGLDVRKWVCPVCGQEHDRDVNAAKNLAKYAYAFKNDIDLKDIYHKVEAEVMAEQ